MIGSSRSFAVLQLIPSPQPTSCLDLQFFKLNEMSRARNRPAENDPAMLPDLLPGMQLSDFHKVSVSALCHYSKIYNLPGDGTKQALSQRLYDYLQAENSSSSGDCDPSEDENTPSRNSTPHRHCSQCHTVSKESGSSTEGKQPPSQTNSHPTIFTSNTHMIDMIATTATQDQAKMAQAQLRASLRGTPLTPPTQKTSALPPSQIVPNSSAVNLFFK